MSIEDPKRDDGTVRLSKEQAEAVADALLTGSRSSRALPGVKRAAERLERLAGTEPVGDDDEHISRVCYTTSVWKVLI